MDREPRPVVIVMVESDEVDARLIETNIRRAGVNNEIIMFRNGGSAVDQLVGAGAAGRDSADAGRLFLLDVDLSDMSGLDVLASIRTNHATRHSPVILMAAAGEEGENQRRPDLGAHVFISKPLSEESFAQAIRDLGLVMTVIQVPDID
ncbi:response regulator [Pleomorphomonas koreensis]|uniref:response regulator n=1 Tax=Pleomorphomonas koreensis TaxID=257440 RepID=UPI00047B9018|nr:response regulator [Pleomorphomonas koreensis]